MSAPPPAAIQDPLDPLRILRWRASASAQVVELAEGVDVTLIAIPATGGGIGETSPSPQRQGSHWGVLERQHVELEAYLLGQTPVTQAQWRVVASWGVVERELNPEPSHFQGEQAVLLEGEETTEQRPVESVSWHEAVEFCQRLRHRTGMAFGMPSEAQWEIGCRAGASTPFAFGAALTPELANYDEKLPSVAGPEGIPPHQTTPVGTYPANLWGLYDMHGNVWEWCADHWHGPAEKAPADGSAWRDPLAPQNIRHVMRGGSWHSPAAQCRSAFRSDGSHPDNAYAHNGFRVCCRPQGLGERR